MEIRDHAAPAIGCGHFGAYRGVWLFALQYLSLLINICALKERPRINGSPDDTNLIYCLASHLNHVHCNLRQTCMGPTGQQQPQKTPLMKTAQLTTNVWAVLFVSVESALVAPTLSAFGIPQRGFTTAIRNVSKQQHHSWWDQANHPE